GATTEEGKRLAAQDKTHNGTVDILADWATTVLNTGVAAGGLSGPLPGAAAETGKTVGTTLLDALAEKYHQDSTALGDHLATQRTIARSEASEAVLQSVIIHHMPTTDLVKAGIADSKTGHIKSRSDWPDDVQNRWKDSVLLLKNGQDLIDVYKAISGHYGDGEEMLWRARKSE
ncbi:MAG: hypothetical protein QG608_3138, partial [Actinomycetota bacterium]|nr:hypothetical protein [Actinomycetota bacterium]